MAGYLGNAPTAVPLTSADITDSTITNADIANSTINLTQKVTGALPVANGGTGLTALGSSLQVLRTNTGATALEFATISTGATAGQVIQVLSATDSTERSTTSTSFVTGSNTLSVTITPSNSSSKFFVICTGQIGSTASYSFTLYRDATNLGDSTTGMGYYGGNQDTTALAISVLDSPATSSAITYQLYMRTTSSDYAVILRGTQKKSLTVFEIKG